MTFVITVYTQNIYSVVLRTTTSRFMITDEQTECGAQSMTGADGMWNTIYTFINYDCNGF